MEVSSIEKVKAILSDDNFKMVEAEIVGMFTGFGKLCDEIRASGGSTSDEMTNLFRDVGGKLFRSAKIVEVVSKYSMDVVNEYELAELVPAYIMMKLSEKLNEVGSDDVS